MVNSQFSFHDQPWSQKYPLGITRKSAFGIRFLLTFYRPFRRVGWLLDVRNGMYQINYSTHDPRVLSITKACPKIPETLTLCKVLQSYLTAVIWLKCVATCSRALNPCNSGIVSRPKDKQETKHELYNYPSLESSSTHTNIAVTI